MGLSQKMAMEENGENRDASLKAGDMSSIVLILHAPFAKNTRKEDLEMYSDTFLLIDLIRV